MSSSAGEQCRQPISWPKSLIGWCETRRARAFSCSRLLERELYESCGGLCRQSTTLIPCCRASACSCSSGGQQRWRLNQAPALREQASRVRGKLYPEKQRRLRSGAAHLINHQKVIFRTNFFSKTILKSIFNSSRRRRF